MEEIATVKGVCMDCFGKPEEDVECRIPHDDMSSPREYSFTG